MSKINMLMLLTLVEAALIVGLVRVIIDLLDGGASGMLTSLKGGGAAAFFGTLTLLTTLLLAFRMIE
ncbi:hypothetical protein OHA84_13380 [Streptomyces sp. NBC_00513]|uniref:hypothetical protein n=1 Tax=unclassified Streptomyces TaxID=2593676 RepID=UPI00225B0E36|nr:MULTISPECIES: hypothetical protein [unclassified Streptomyces]MCX5075461.1 hypothetical protein [Streptomyces sp. NBC_00424]MCX5152917.1 hypothetical protein [Streptomyces sp. NBC_00291]WUD41429.1 hypothetical protein OHA84_13380 [Streptomyces sp. NBC_00513]